jgi:hypothetical protein
MPIAEAIAKGLLDPRSATIMTPEGAMSLEEAAGRGLVDLERGLCKDPASGRWIPLEEAARRGLLQPSAGGDEPQTLGDLVEKGLYDVNTGLVTDPKTGRKIPLAQAIEEGLVDRKSAFVVDPATGQLVGLADAIERGLVDADGRPESLAEAVRKGLEAQKKADEGAGVVLDANSGLFVDPGTGQEMPIAEAIAKGLLDPRSATIMTPEGAMSLEEAAGRGLVDLERGLCKDPASGRWIPLEEAARRGLF